MVVHAMERLHAMPRACDAATQQQRTDAHGQDVVAVRRVELPHGVPRSGAGIELCPVPNHGWGPSRSIPAGGDRPSTSGSTALSTSMYAPTRSTTPLRRSASPRLGGGVACSSAPARDGVQAARPKIPYAICSVKPLSYFRTRKCTELVPTEYEHNFTRCWVR